MRKRINEWGYPRGRAWLRDRGRVILAQMFYFVKGWRRIFYRIERMGRGRAEMRLDQPNGKPEWTG